MIFIVYIGAVYIILINIIAFASFGLDKHYAKRHMWRISEASLIFLCIIGGSVGAIFGMEIFRHKTKHLKFKFGVPVILIIQLALAVITFVYVQYGIRR